MKSVLLVLIFSVVGLLPASLLAAPALDPYTSEHIWILPHTKPAWFESDGNGGFYGETLEGVAFTQSVIANQAGIKLHRFSIGTAYFYITDKGVIEAPSDIAAISIYLTYNE